MSGETTPGQELVAVVPMRHLADGSHEPIRDDDGNELRVCQCCGYALCPACDGHALIVGRRGRYGCRRLYRRKVEGCGHRFIVELRGDEESWIGSRGFSGLKAGRQP